MSQIHLFQEIMRQRGYGNFLWTHEPEENRPDGVLLGDFGYINKADGSFNSLFNAIRHKDHPLNLKYGVPSNFQHVDHNANHYRKVSNAIQPGQYLGAGRTKNNDLEVSLTACLANTTS